MKKILLAGNPNTGKSTCFARMTGVDVIISNYPGTTVELKKGRMKLKGEAREVIDVPGIYSLSPANEAEKIAVKKLLSSEGKIINVVDGLNLERNLYLTLELIEKGLPIVVALNFCNELRHRGVKIDVKKLEKLLGVPVIPISAIAGQGIKKLVDKLPELKSRPETKVLSDKERWQKIEAIIKQVQEFNPKKHTFWEHLEDFSIHPLTGIPAGLFIIFASFVLVRFVGEFLINYIFNPLFSLYYPVVLKISAFLGPGLWRDILIGSFMDGKIAFDQSMGLLTTGLFVPIAMVLPYVLAFYAVLGILEDSGYLPRLATLLDTLMHKLGMHGLAVVPMFLGLGCNVPGVLSVRILQTKKERFVAAALLAVSVPCMAQMAVIFSLLGSYGAGALISYFLILFIVWLVLGIVLNKLIKGEAMETFMEIPPYRLPNLLSFTKKLWMRMKNFIYEAIPFVFLGVLIINILYVFNVVAWLGDLAAPVMSRLLGLPLEAVLSLIVGFIRKDMAVGILSPLGLSLKQLLIASVMLTMYFPCVATFVVLFKEVRLKGLLQISAIMIFMSLFVGGLLNLVL
ncbi:ferrous iron transporter B [Candidatus Falkowbacteria bacterium]|nr:MAG: ferrous iron transporter B [Candidatus Falkowbacteria bacterium]